MLESEGKLPDALVACVEGSNALPFLSFEDEEVKLIGVKLEVRAFLLVSTLPH